MSAAVSKISTGEVVDGKYRVGRQLGQGGMGAVYEATHLGTSRRVALKVIVSEALASGPDVITRFEREARASGAIDSAHVVQVLDSGVDPGTTYPYMVMEYLSGEDLSQLVRRLGPLPPDLVLRIGAQACLGLQRAHDASVVHRDIKSANLFLARRDGGDVQVKVLDFGIAKVRADPLQGGQDHGLTQTGSMLGSPLYMSPEQARSAKMLDGRSDIWSLGVALFEALVGKTPFHDKTTLGDLLFAICVDPLPSLQESAPWLAPEVVSIVERALTRDVDARFATPREMYEAIAALLPGGVAIHESMLGPLTPEMRAQIAPRVERPVATADRPADATPLEVTPVVGGMQPAGSGATDASAPVPTAQGVTAGDLARSSPRTNRRNAALVVALLGGLAVTGAGVTAARLRRAGLTNGSPSSEVIATPLPSSALVPTRASADAVPQVKEAPAREARLVVAAPAGASIEVNGAPAELREGSVALSGGPGSLHKVIVRTEDDAQDFDVSILANGTTMPSRIELVAKKKAPVAPAAPAVKVAPVAAKPPAGPAPAATPSEPAFKTQF